MNLIDYCHMFVDHIVVQSSLICVIVFCQRGCVAVTELQK